jgi:glycosyltransferase involved in cell wall biosynthesis
LLSAALIVRDEQRHLEGCLASIRELVDEIVVVDTGSHDRTREIARAGGARLLELDWSDDFSAARNFGLAHCAGRWILYIDADERARPLERQRLAAELDDPSQVALTVRFRPRVGYTPYREYRLFRNDPRIRFRGRIHEKVHPAILEVASSDALAIGASALELDHLGYEGDQRRKHRRNLPLLRAQLEREPDKVYNWHHLGRVLAALGDRAGAEAAWLQAITLSRQKRELAGEDCLAYMDLLRSNAQSGIDTAALLAEARARFPDNWSLIWTEGQLLLAGGRHAQAAERFGRLLAVDADAVCEAAVAHDLRIFGELSWAGLGSSAFALGDYERSAECFTQAARAAPDRLEYRVKAELALGRACSGPEFRLAQEGHSLG